MAFEITELYSIELDRILQYITTELIEEYPTTTITTDYFILAILINKNNLAYKIIDECLISDKIDAIIKLYHEQLSKKSMMVIKPNRKIKFDDEFKSHLEYSKTQMDTLKDIHITTEHVLLSILERGKTVKTILEASGIDYGIALQKINRLRTEKNELTTSKNNIIQNYQTPKTKNEKHMVQPIMKIKTGIKNGFIEKYSIDLNSLAECNQIDEIIGREKEIKQIFNILGRRTKNNVILVGDGGVGKTSIVKHLANLIVNKNVPNSFKKKKLIQIDIAAIVAGTNFRGMFEERIKGILDEAKKNKNYIMFIDDIHNVLSEKSQTGDVNIISMLNNILTEGDVQVIGCTNFKDFKNSIENNTSLNRKFQKLIVNPSSIDESIEILNGCKQYYEEFHNVTYTNEAINACVKLSNRYISDKTLPDSAIDILDEIGSFIKNNKKKNIEVVELEKEISNIKEQKDYAIKNDDFDMVDKLTNILNKKIVNLSEMEKVMDKNTPFEIKEENIKEIISLKTSIPIENINYNEKKKLLKINDLIKESVIGQDAAVDCVCNEIKRNRVGLGDINKPTVLFFGGKTGTGKTLLAKKIAELVYGDEKYLVKLDMSEYADKAAVNKLTGSAPGYVGFEQGGTLCNIIRNKKYCVLLLDEIEKATTEVHNMFLQVFDDGKLTDNLGITIDFKNIIIIMTSNVGAKKSMEFGNGIGFNTTSNNKQKEIIEKELKNKFSPEFINRISEIVYFETLNEDTIKDIIKLELNKLNDKLMNINLNLNDNFYSEITINYLFNNIKDYDQYGARTIFKVIRNLIEKPITQLILERECEDEYVFDCEIIDEKLIIK